MRRRGGRTFLTVRLTYSLRPYLLRLYLLHLLYLLYLLYLLWRTLSTVRLTLKRLFARPAAGEAEGRGDAAPLSRLVRVRD